MAGPGGGMPLGLPFTKKDEVRKFLNMAIFARPGVVSTRKKRGF